MCTQCVKINGVTGLQFMCFTDCCEPPGMSMVRGMCTSPSDGYS